MRSSPAPLRGPGARGSAEGRAASAGAGGIGVGDVEARTLEPVAVVERGPREQLGARRVDHHLDALVVGGEVVAGLIGSILIAILSVNDLAI